MQRRSFKYGFINIVAIRQDENGYIQMKTAWEVWIDKNTRGKIATAESLLIKPDVGEIHYDPIIFEIITGEAIKIAAYKTQGTASPLEIDAYAWHRSALIRAQIISTKHGLRSFRYFASKNWNAMPDAVRAMVGTKEFINKVRHMKF